MSCVQSSHGRHKPHAFAASFGLFRQCRHFRRRRDRPHAPPDHGNGSLIAYSTVTAVLSAWHSEQRQPWFWTSAPSHRAQVLSRLGLTSLSFSLTDGSGFFRRANHRAPKNKAGNRKRSSHLVAMALSWSRLATTPAMEKKPVSITIPHRILLSSRE